jgi:hypothetical protein
MPRRKTAAQLDAEIAEALAGRGSRGFNRYRHLSPDDARGNPLHAWGQLHADKLGSYWTTEVDVPLGELALLRPVLQSKARLNSVASARKAGKPLPPLELGIYQDGSAWIVDGNHRLIDARRAGLASIPVTFTFVGT